jgi:hypothetical protein
MNLLIQVQDREIVLILKNGDKTVDKLTWQDENNLSLSLLKNFDKLLSRNKIKAMDLEKSETKIEKTGLSTRRIVETFSKTLSFCLTK